MRKFIYLNGKKSVEIEEKGSEVINVYIDGEAYKFKDTDNSSDKLRFAIDTKRAKYSKFLNYQFENLIVLTGAGSSFDIGKPLSVEGKEVERKGKLLSQLWDDVCNEISTPVIDRLCDLIKYSDFETVEKKRNYVKNLEKLLSLAHISKNYVVDTNIDSPIVIEDLIKKIEKLIKTHCTLNLPEDSPHVQFPNQELSIRFGGEDFLYDARKLKGIGEIKFTGRIVLESGGCVMIVDSMNQIVLSLSQMRKVISKPKKHNSKEREQIIDPLNGL